MADIEEKNNEGSAIEAPEDEGESLLVYELGYHLLPSIAEEDIPSKVANIREQIEKHGGTVIGDGFPHKINLAYTMKRNIGGKYDHFDSVYFGWIKFEMSTSAVVLLQEELGRAEDVLRFLLIKTTREDSAPVKSIVTQPDGFRSQVIRKPQVAKRPTVRVSDEELDKTIEKMVAD